MQILNILTHPDLANSRINKALKNAVKDENIVFHNLYEKYKDFNIDVEAEQELLSKFDKVVFQFPIFWYSCPPLLKKYFDDVFTYGFAYGSSGKALNGKDFAFCVSFGVESEALTSGGKVGFSVDELLTPFIATTQFVGANYKGYFAVFKALRDLEDSELIKKCKEYKEFIKKFGK